MSVRDGDKQAALEHVAPDSSTGERAAPRPLAPRLPAIIALLVIGGIYLLLPERLTLGPRWAPLALTLLLLVPTHVFHVTGRHHISRGLALLLTSCVTAAVAVSAAFLVIRLPGGQPRAPELLLDAALIWIANVLVFALWYWEVDDGGPHRRHVEGYRPTDFAFPQAVIGDSTVSGWCPGFVDYLFLAFNTSTAFSPTDTMVLSHRAKALMMFQSIVSLVVLAVLAARAINTL